MAERREAKRGVLRRGSAPSGGGPYVGWDDERDIPVLVDEQQNPPEQPCPVSGEGERDEG